MDNNENQPPVSFLLPASATGGVPAADVSAALLIGGPVVGLRAGSDGLLVSIAPDRWLALGYRWPVYADVAAYVARALGV
jgi:hypothetical protein